MVEQTKNMNGENLDVDSKNQEFSFSEAELELRLKELASSMQKPNVLVCGQTGAGKSSIINFLFKEDVAPVGCGRPVTQATRLYESENINIYDSKGYEIGNEEAYRKELFDDLIDNLAFNMRDEKNGLHVVWYVIKGSCKRFTDFDKEILDEIQKRKKIVCVVISQIDCLDSEELKELLDAIPKDYKVFRTSIKKEAIEYRDDDGKGYTDWQELCEWTYEKIPEANKLLFAGSLKDAIALQSARADKFIYAATASAAGVGATPIPVADAVVLVPIQTTMIVAICKCYGEKLNANVIAGSGFDVIISNFGKQLAKILATSLAKLIPGYGSIAGGVAGAVVAAGFTFGIGKATSLYMRSIAEARLKGEKPLFDIQEMLSSPAFKEMVNNFMKQYKSEKK